ncbi:MAG TPA: RDD family protein [Opitutaceae bacterium]|nr:RDD family protein [Opitutaceae bacterium]
MKTHPLIKYLSAVAAVALLGAVALRSEDTPPPAPAPATPAPAQPAPAAQPAPEPAPAPAAAQPPAAEMRRLDTEAPAAAPAAETPKAMHTAPRHHARMSSGDNAKVSIGYNTHVAAGEQLNDAAVSIAGNTTVDGDANDAAVSVLGSTTVNGTVGDAAVSVLGTTTVNGSVGDAAVAVLGDTRVNGTVHGDVVAVLGNVDLGPKAVVKGQVVVIGGTPTIDPAAVHGSVQTVSIGGHFPGFGWLYAWVKSALLKGRLLSFAAGTGWAWLVAAAFLLLYTLVALIFPRGVEKCAETLEQRPGFTILATLLTMLAIPLVIVLLAITGIGVVVIPFLGIGLVVAKLFGRVAMLAWFGRRFTGLFGQGNYGHAAVTVIIGGVVVMLLYLVPILAFIVHALIGVLGLGMVVYALVLNMRKNGAKSAAAAPAAAMPAAPAPAAPVAGMAFAAAGAEPAAGAVAPGAVPPVPAAPVPPVISAVTLPRAGFWIRLLAMAIDLILVLIVTRLVPWLHVNCGLFGLLAAAYAAVLWKLRGTTVGGSIFHLKVVRLDDRPLDWTAAIVRALGCLISLVVIGLGFLWVVFDDGKQSWHDKIAGTTVVRVPKGVSLI